jgi:SH3-like domain-containing protein
VNAYVESGVVARLGKCDLDWCRVNAKGSKGWVPKRVLWGVMPEELRD